MPSCSSAAATLASSSGSSAFKCEHRGFNGRAAWRGPASCRLCTFPRKNHYVGYRRPHPPRRELVVSPEVTAAFRRQAEQDLVRFLTCRARELVPGGKLLLASPGDSDQACVADGLADVLNDACLDLVVAGLIKREQYERFTFPS